MLFFTVTLTFTDFFPAFTVMVALPAFLAVILPDLLTVATFLLEVLNVTLSCAVIGDFVTTSVVDFPFVKVTFFLSTEIFFNATAFSEQ